MSLINDDTRSELRPACRVPAGALASEVCAAGTAGEATDDALEDLDFDTMKRATTAGFAAAERGGSYQDGWHSVVDPAVAKIKAARAAKAAARADECGCGCTRTELSSAVGTARKDNMSSRNRGVDLTAPMPDPGDTDEDRAVAALRRDSMSAWAAPNARRAPAAAAVQVDDSDTSEEAAKVALRDRGLNAWRGGR